VVLRLSLEKDCSTTNNQGDNDDTVWTAGSQNFDALIVELDLCRRLVLLVLLGTRLLSGLSALTPHTIMQAQPPNGTTTRVLGGSDQYVYHSALESGGHTLYCYSS
jgi:hypothetical protein